MSRVVSPHVLFPDARTYVRPEELGLSARPLEAVRSDGTRLRGALFASSNADLDDPSLPLVIFLHGNSGNLSAHLFYVELVTRAGCRAVAFDMSGFGRSDGRPDVRALLPDAHAAVDAARALDGGAGSVGLFGVSLGANLALATAASRSDVAAIAVEGLSRQRDLVHGIVRWGTMGRRTVTSIRLDGCALHERERCPALPLRAPGGVAAVVARCAEAAYPFDGKRPDALLDALGRTPLLVIHGTDDPILPFEAAVEVFGAYGGPKWLWLIPAGGHAQDPAFRADVEYVEQLAGLFKKRRDTTPSVRVCVDDATGATFSLVDGQPPGAFLLGSMSERRLELLRAWLEPGVSATIDGDCGGPSVAWATRMHAIDRDGATWRPASSPRQELYAERFATVLAELNRLTRASRAEEALERIEAEARRGAAPPFDAYLRLFAGRIADTTRTRRPRLAARAREALSALGAPVEAAAR